VAIFSSWAGAQVTTTDQITAEVGQEPLKTLAEFRSGRVLGWNARPEYKREFMFGWNLVRPALARPSSAGAFACQARKGLVQQVLDTGRIAACAAPLLSHIGILSV